MHLSLFARSAWGHDEASDGLRAFVQVDAEFDDQVEACVVADGGFSEFDYGVEGFDFRDVHVG